MVVLHARVTEAGEIAVTWLLDIAVEPYLPTVVSITMTYPELKTSAAGIDIENELLLVEK
jgi:hypothetical protein